MAFKTAIVIGGGAFGSAIAFVLAQNFSQVLILVRLQRIYEDINLGKNTAHLPGHKLHRNIIEIKSWDVIDHEQQSDDGLIVSGLPMSAIHEFMATNSNAIIKYLKN